MKGRIRFVIYDINLDLSEGIEENHEKALI